MERSTKLDSVIYLQSQDMATGRFQPERKPLHSLKVAGYASAGSAHGRIVELERFTMQSIAGYRSARKLVAKIAIPYLPPP